MQNYKSTPDSLKQIFKAFGRKLPLGAPGEFQPMIADGKKDF